MILSRRFDLSCFTLCDSRLSLLTARTHTHKKNEFSLALAPARFNVCFKPDLCAFGRRLSLSHSHVQHNIPF